MMTKACVTGGGFFSRKPKRCCGIIPALAIAGLIPLTLMAETISTPVKPKVLVVESYHKTFPWDLGYTRGIRETLADDFELYFFRMDTKRLPKNLYAKQADKAMKAYNSLQPQVVILGDDNALRLVGTQLVPMKANIVYLGINNNPRAYGIKDFSRLTGVLERPLLKRSLLEMKAFVKMKAALAMFDSSVTSTIIRSEILGKEHFLKAHSTSLYYRQYVTFEEWKQAVIDSNTEGFQALFVGLYQHLQAEDGSFVPELEVIEWTSKHSEIPVFAFWDFAIGPKMAAGGYVLKGIDQGRAAGNLAKDLLNRADTSKSIPPKSINSGHYVFSRSEVKRWGLQLPKSLDTKVEWLN